MNKKIRRIIIIIDIIYALLYIVGIYSNDLFGYSVRLWLADVLSIGFIFIANGSFIYYLIATRKKIFNNNIYKILKYVVDFCVGLIIITLSIGYIFVLVVFKDDYEYTLKENGKTYIILIDPVFDHESKYEYGNIFFRGKEVYVNKEITTKE